MLALQEALYRSWAEDVKIVFGQYPEEMGIEPSGETLEAWRLLVEKEERDLKCEH